MSGLADEAYWAKTKKTKIHHLSWLSSIPFLPHLSTCPLSSPAAHQWGEAWRPMGPSAGGGSAGWRTAMEEREGKGGGVGGPRWHRRRGARRDTCTATATLCHGHLPQWRGMRTPPPPSSPPIVCVAWPWISSRCSHGRSVGKLKGKERHVWL